MQDAHDKSKPGPRTVDGLLLLGAAIWGTTFLVTKILLTGSRAFAPFNLLAVRFAIATVFGWLVLRPDPKAFRPNVKGGMIIGLATFLGFAFQTCGLLWTTPAKSGFITALFVLFIPFVSRVWEKVVVAPRTIVALVPALTGLWAISGAGSSLAEINLGDRITLLSAFSYAFQIVGIQVYGTRGDWKWLTILQFAVIAIGSAIACVFEQQKTAVWDLAGIGAIVYLATVASVGALSVQVYAQRFTTSARASFIYLTEPVFAALFAWLLGGMGMTWLEVTGGAAIILALIIANWETPKARPH